MLVAGVEARSLTLARGGGGGERGDNHLSNTFKFFSKEYKIHNTYIILLLMLIAFMKKVNFHEHFFIILDS